MKKTIIFYSHNFWWLGHNKRLSLIIRKLLLSFWEKYNCLLLNSWEKQDFLFENINWLKIINLPKYEFENYILIWNHKKIKNLRKIVFQKLFALNIEIESLIVEHYPFWRNFLDEEIKYLIQEFRQYNKNWNVFSSVRDIFDLNSLNEKNLDLFDRILIHSDKKLFNYEKIFQEKICNKIIYTWYVVDYVKKIKQSQQYILITLWGWQDWYNCIELFLSEFKKVWYKGDIYISLWKSYSSYTEEKIKTMFWKDIVIKNYFEDFVNLKINASLVVSMWGYNNLVENLFYKIKTIVYPRTIDNEQQIRLKKFSKITNYMIDWLSTSIDDIKRLLNMKEKKLHNEVDFNWAYFTSNFITNFKKYKYIKIRLTNLCNAKCDMCWVIKREIKSNNIDKIKETIIDFYKLWWEIVNFTWWEPTIYNWFWDLLNLSKSLWLITSVSTNWGTLWDDFIWKIFHNWKKTIDYMDISVDWLYKDHDIKRKYIWLFEKISNNIPKLISNYVFIHINITIRKDNISQLLYIFDYFKKLWVNSISFWMIASDPLNDTSKLIPSKNAVKNFYFFDKELIKKDSRSIKIWFSPDFNWSDFDSFYKSIKWKNAFPKKVGNICLHINFKKEIRVNENWNISPCCIIDDFDEWLWNINTNNLLNIICSKNYEDYLNKKFPNISKACLNCKIEINE